MSRIKDLRTSFDKKLDALELQASALEAQLTQSKEQALQRLEERKQRLLEVLKQIRADVETSKELAEQAKTDVQAKLDRLQVQLALGKAEARDAFEEQRAKILSALSEFEAAADLKLKEAAFQSGRLWEDLVGRACALEAELDAVKSRFESKKVTQEASLEAKKRDLLAKVRAYQDELKDKRRVVQAKADTFEMDMRAAFFVIPAGLPATFLRGLSLLGRRQLHPARRAFDNPIATAYFADFALCLPLRK